MAMAKYINQVKRMAPSETVYNTHLRSVYPKFSLDELEFIRVREEEWRAKA